MSELDDMSDAELSDEMKEVQDELSKLGSDGSDSSVGYPKAPKQESIFKFFKEILDLKGIMQIAKTGNLTKEEIGYLRNSVRTYMSIGHYAQVEGLDKVSEYLNKKAEIVLATSLSRNAKMLETFVTQIKKTQNLTRTPPSQKGGWFGMKPKEPVTEEAQ